MAGILPSAVLPLLWLIYLSLSIVCRDFLGFQWDTLLLETGFLAIFLAPLTRRERLRSLVDPPRVAVWLMLWLLFRLMVGSGAVKLTSGDPAWHNLTALAFHFETQPIPTPVAWYAHRLPLWFLKASTVVMFAIEIGVPFLIVAPRRLRALAFVPLAGFQALIALTGNYAFFNLLTAALCLFLLDDTALGSWGADPDRIARRQVERGAALLVAVAVMTVPVSAFAFTGALGIGLPGAALIDPLANADCAVSQRERVRPLCRHDDDAAGNHSGRIGGWRHMARVRIQVQSRRRAPPAALGCPASAAARLADVVCRARPIRR